MLKIKDMPKEERPQERLQQYGAKALGNAELLAIILRTGTKKENVLTLSQKILQKHQIANISRIKLNTLKKTFGIGEVKASQIIACLELAKRLAKQKIKNKKTIKTTKDIANLLQPELKHLKKEHFIGIFLDAKNKIIHKETIFIGTLTATIIHPREIYQIAIQESAAKIIIAHNHPSGSPKPSTQDIEITKQLLSAGKILGIELVDHLIIGKSTYCALREQGYC